MNRFLLVSALLLQSAVAWPAAASDAPAPPSTAAQDHAQIRDTVAGFVQEQTAALPGKVTYQVGEIDRRIVLSRCASLEAFLPAGSQLIGKTSVGVRCNAPAHNDRSGHPGGWSIFIPVQVRISLDLLTSARQLPLGHTLQEQDLATQTMEISRPGGFTDPAQVIGKVLRYGIAAGQVLREDMLRQPYSVTQGQVGPLAVQGDGFSIRSEGVALNNATEGQSVQIRVGSGRVVGGVARAGGMVEIAP